MRPVKTLVLVLLAGGLAACSTNPITGRSQFMVVSESMAIGESAAAYSSMMGGLSKKKQIEADGERTRKVREITDRLVAQAVRFRPDSANWKWEVQVIDDPKTVNAFCMAGGKMAIYTGIWEKLKATDDEVAQVMGHEIGHALASHTRERMSIAMTSSVVAEVAAIAVSNSQNPASGLALPAAQMAALLAIQLPNSRQSESEADQIGIELAARAGYDPKAAVTLWDKMGKLGGTPPEFLSTHPSPEHRKERLQALGEQVQPLYAAARDGKLAGAPSQAPSFLSSPEGANERTVAKPGELTREEYARSAASQPEAMTFLSEPFERFKSGKASFDCRAGCSFAYGSKKGGWKAMHAQGKWRDLAIAVVQVGYLSDLSYFMLAESARNLGLKEAAAAYYQRAVEAGKQFGCGGPLSSCEGFEVQKLSAAALH
jgi:Zn-dependent protease with chaperone function